MKKISYIILLALTSLFFYSCVGEDVIPEQNFDFTVNDDDDPLTSIEENTTPPPPPTVAPEITLSSLSVGLMVGQEETLTASYRDSLGTEAEVPFTWASEDESIVTVNDGLITAIAEGSVNVTVSFEDVTTTASINVVPDENAPSTIEVGVERNEILEPGETKSLSVTVFNLAGDVIEPENIVWTVNDGSVASIDANNMLTAIGEGTTQFFVSANGLTSGSVSITVVEPEPEPVLPKYLERVATLGDVPPYETSGTAIIRQEVATGDISIILSDDFSYQRAIRINLVLSASENFDRSVPNFVIEPELINQGAQSYNLTEQGYTGNINSLDHVLVVCIPFNLAFGTGELGGVTEVAE